MRILLADHDARVRASLSMLLGSVPELTVVGESDNATDLLAVAPQLAPDLVLLDWELPGRVDASLVALLRQRVPVVKILVLSSRSECERPAARADADGFVSKADSAEHLLAYIGTLLGAGPARTTAC